MLFCSTFAKCAFLQEEGELEELHWDHWALRSTGPLGSSKLLSRKPQPFVKNAGRKAVQAIKPQQPLFLQGEHPKRSRRALGSDSSNFSDHICNIFQPSNVLNTTNTHSLRSTQRKEHDKSILRALCDMVETLCLEQESGTCVIQQNTRTCTFASTTHMWNWLNISYDLFWSRWFHLISFYLIS